MVVALPSLAPVTLGLTEEDEGRPCPQAEVIKSLRVATFLCGITGLFCVLVTDVGGDDHHPHRSTTTPLPHVSPSCSVEFFRSCLS